VVANVRQGGAVTAARSTVMRHPDGNQSMLVRNAYRKRLKPAHTIIGRDGHDSRSACHVRTARAFQLYQTYDVVKKWLLFTDNPLRAHDRHEGDIRRSLDLFDRLVSVGLLETHARPALL